MYQVCERVTEQQGLTLPEHTHRLRCLQLLTDFYGIVTTAGDFLPDQDSHRVFNVVNEFLLRQNKLNALYGFEREEAKRQKHYNITFKSHVFWHMADLSKWCNPKAGWNYGNERFVGKVALITRSVVMGGGCKSLGINLPTKWRFLQYFRMKRRQSAVYVHDTTSAQA